MLHRVPTRLGIVTSKGSLGSRALGQSFPATVAESTRRYYWKATVKEQRRFFLKKYPCSSTTGVHA